MNDSKTVQQGTKRLFVKLGTCSQLFFHILNDHFGHPNERAERASDPLCGGLMQKGHQCGMLWGAALAVGAESFRRNSDHDRAIALSIMATQALMESFSNRAESIICRDITHCDFSSTLSTAKYMLSGHFLSCFNLAEEWAPEAIQSADNSLSLDPVKQPQQAVSCATEVAKRMGASDEETVMVAGFAGGLGLSGNACGALAAAIWMNTLPWCEEHTKAAISNPNATATLERFYAATDHEILCQKISGRSFKTMEDHAEYIRGGGCDKLINLLAQSL